MVHVIGTSNLNFAPLVQSTPQGVPELYCKQLCCQRKKKKKEPIREIITLQLKFHPARTGIRIFQSADLISAQTWCLISELAASPLSKDTIMNYREMYGDQVQSLISKEHIHVMIWLLHRRSLSRTSLRCVIQKNSVSSTQDGSVLFSRHCPWADPSRERNAEEGRMRSVRRTGCSLTILRDCNNSCECRTDSFMHRIIALSQTQISPLS